MAKQIQLTIAEPCHENWENMTPSEKGKFCGSCQKQVVDFTNMSDAQVTAFFKKPSNGSVCGRFMNDQLDRDITIPRKRMPWIKYFFQLSLPLFLASLKANAQKGKVVVKQIETTTNINKRVVIKGDTDVRIVVDQPVPIISGKIVNQEGNPVPYASVMIKGTDLGTAADSSGHFNLRMPADADSGILNFSSVGFTDREMILRKEDFNKQDIVVQLEKSSLPEVIVISYPLMGKYAITGAVCTIRKVKNNIPVIPESEIRSSLTAIYPNPVAAKGSITIDCSKMEKTDYSLQLLSMSGSVILQKEMQINRETRVFKLTVPDVASGTYLVRMISGKTGKSYTDKIFIQ